MISQVKCKAGSWQSHPGSQVGMVGSRLRWWDPTFATWNENLMPLGIPHLMRDSCIPPGILGGISASHLGAYAELIPSTWDPSWDLHIPPTKTLFCCFYSYKTFLWDFQYLSIIHTLRKYLACGQGRGGYCSLRENTPFKWLLQFSLFETLIWKYF